MNSGEIYDRSSATPGMAEVERIIAVCLSVILSLSYCYFISSRIPKGRYRFISILPILYLFTILPLYLSFTLSRFITSFFIAWLGTSKLILFCFDQGPLSWGPAKSSLLLFITVAALPCKIKLDKDEKSSEFSVPTKPRTIPHVLATKVVVLAVLITILHNCREGGRYSIHLKLVSVLYCFLLYLNVDVIVAPVSTVVQAVIGIELEPPSDEPYLSTSLQDFWGRRWNLMITNILRHSVYLPVRSASVGVLGKGKASLVAVFASFVVSALMHEFFLFYYLTERAAPTWEMTSFFLLHGVCVVVEMVVKRKLVGRWRMNPYVSRLVTVGFVVITCLWLFLPPITKAGLDVTVIGEFMLFLEYVKNKLQFILMHLTAQTQN